MIYGVALSLVVLIVGLLMYALSANPKLQEIGRIMFAFGLLAFMLGARAGLEVMTK
jgi:Na+/phosphate symporter